MKLFVSQTDGEALVAVARALTERERLVALARGWASILVGIRAIRATLAPGRLTGDGADDARLWLTRLESVLLSPLPAPVRGLLLTLEARDECERERNPRLPGVPETGPASPSAG